MKATYFMIIELKPGSRSKEDRISGLEPLFRCGDIILVTGHKYVSVYDKQEHDGVEELVNELLRQTMAGNKSGHDDMGDCLAYFIDMNMWTSAKPVPKKTLKEYKEMKWEHPDFEDVEDDLQVEYQHGNMFIEEEREKSGDPVTGYT